MQEKSKFLSYLLRHKPESKNLQLDKEGWITLQELVDKAGFTHAELVEIAKLDGKQRYTISDDGLRIRANQGHSTTQVRMTFDRAVPPPVLYHGTAYETSSIVLKEGLKPMSRHHVHLSADEQVAIEVAGRRRGSTIVLKIDAAKMLADGIRFYKSVNGVWLVDYVHPKYCTVIDEKPKSK